VAGAAGLSVISVVRQHHDRHMSTEFEQEAAESAEGGSDLRCLCCLLFNSGYHVPGDEMAGDTCVESFIRAIRFIRGLDHGVHG